MIALTPTTCCGGGSADGGVLVGLVAVAGGVDEVLEVGSPAGGDVYVHAVSVAPTSIAAMKWEQ